MQPKNVRGLHPQPDQESSMTRDTPQTAEARSLGARSPAEACAQSTALPRQEFEPDRRRSLQSALAFALFPYTSLTQAQSMNTSTDTDSNATLVAANTTTTRDDGAGAAIRPFKYKASDAELAELRRRIMATRFPEKETVNDDSQGVQLATVEALARYWAKEYDWRKVEARLNAYPQFMTEIDGLDIHFLHVRSKHENALPLIVTHGWPGSIIEQLKIIEPLTNPTAHGGSASDAFHVVIPSMPGYGFSGKPTTTGWDPEHIARAWVVLMKRLGYKKFVAQGGDWGAIITEFMGAHAAPELLGVHTNMANAIPADIDKAAFSGAPAPSGLTPDEKLAYERLQFVYQKGIGYGFQLGLRPQTMYALADSPVGLAAYFLDHDQRSYRLIARAFAGQPGGLTRDDVLDNITLTWLTGTAVSSGRLYWENKHSFFGVRGIKIPSQ
jgi:pimeloyl-ACP methyl ester carboxylesterase